MTTTTEISAKPAKRGPLFVISAPSGAGKTTLCRALIDRFPELRYSVSHTTRPPRNGEQDGRDYHFIPAAEFKKKIETGSWAEWAEVHDHYYGTSADFIDAQISAGHPVLLDIDVQGARQIRKRYPDSVTIFVMPPSLDSLRQRLTLRGTDTEQTIEKRMLAAEVEMKSSRDYQYVIVNDRLPETVQRLVAIVEKHQQDR